VVGAGGRHIHALTDDLPVRRGAGRDRRSRSRWRSPRSGDKDGARVAAGGAAGLRRRGLGDRRSSGRCSGASWSKPFELEAFDAGEDSTTVEVHVHDDERQIMKRGDDAGLLLSVQPIFNAIGKVGGRQLFVTLPEAMPEALKP
jgi:hypothetical protein